MKLTLSIELTRSRPEPELVHERETEAFSMVERGPEWVDVDARRTTGFSS